MKTNFFIFTFILFGFFKLAQSQEIDISAPYHSIEVPTNGFISLQENSCDSVIDFSWQSLSADSFDVMISANGPSGSGRYWNVIVGIADSGKQTPTRGVCLNTSTIGWRTLQSFNKLPLQWIDDKDKDGLPEIIIWDSFPLHREASNAEYGLIAWIFEYNGNNKFTINKHLTIEIIGEIASAYRKPIKDANDRITKTRQNIARILDKFISRKFYIDENL